MKQGILLLILFFSAAACMAQDRIFKKGGEVIKAKITEVGSGEIKYIPTDRPDGPVYALEKARILKIIFADGHTETYANNLKDPELYADQKKGALKISFLSPLFGYTQFAYERSLKPGRSMEFTLGIIGLGKNSTIEDYNYSTGQPQEIKRDAKGVTIGVGYKFSKLPDFVNKDIRYSHVLQGAYAKPVLYFGVYGENVVDDKTGVPTEDRITTTYGALLVELGKQWVFSESILLDLYFGVGYVVDNFNNSYSASMSDEYAAHHFNVIRGGKSPSFGLNGGLKIGILLK